MSLPQIEVNSQKIILELLTNSIYIGTFICDSRQKFLLIQNSYITFTIVYIKSKEFDKLLKGIINKCGN